jgi:hypothetical protein
MPVSVFISVGSWSICRYPPHYLADRVEAQAELSGSEPGPHEGPAGGDPVAHSVSRRGEGERGPGAVHRAGPAVLLTVITSTSVVSKSIVIGARARGGWSSRSNAGSLLPLAS